MEWTIAQGAVLTDETDAEACELHLDGRLLVAWRPRRRGQSALQPSPANHARHVSTRYSTVDTEWHVQA